MRQGDNVKYSALDKINLFLTIYYRMFGNIFRISAWSPLLIAAVFQTAGLLLLIDYGRPVSGTFIYPLLKALLPSAALHYPNYYLAIPLVFSAYDIWILGPSIWLLAIGAVTISTGAIYDKQRIGIAAAAKTAAGRYGLLLGLWIIQTILMIIFVYLPARLISDSLTGYFLRHLAMKIALQGVGFVISAFTLYTIASILLDKNGLFKSLAISARLWKRNFFFSFFIVALPGSIGLIFDILTSSFAPNIINGGNPELIIQLLFLKIFLGVFLGLFHYGSAVYAYREIGG